MPARKPLGPRVDTLEDKVDALERTTAQLKRDQSATSRIVRDLVRTVEGILPTVKTELNAQTATINRHVDDQLSELRQSFFSSLIDVARQWSAQAIIAVTVTLTLAAGILTNWVLAAEHLPHIH